MKSIANEIAQITEKTAISYFSHNFNTLAEFGNDVLTPSLYATYKVDAFAQEISDNEVAILSDGYLPVKLVLDPESFKIRVLESLANDEEEKNQQNKE